MTLDLRTAKWMNSPRDYAISDNAVKLTTEPHTDLWQRTYYGFRRDNAPALLFESLDNFTFTVKASFTYHSRYDQCGVIIRLDSENWFKAAVEYENDRFSRLGSVVTNSGHSDWASTDIETPKEIRYRLNRRGPDFLIESSIDGETFHQMRIFHLHKLGETTAEKGQQNPPAKPEHSIRFGLYACSPLNSSFTAIFEKIEFEECQWLAHE
ncbi:MAG TPA: DUF1349 domain-containing protein [bacterium]|nr:DUF1349 domain-containing protein [bacterium]